MPLGGSSARRYSEALLDFAVREDAVAAYRSSLDRLAQALGPDTIRVLRDPRISVERRRAALGAATRDEPRAIRAVLDLLLQRDRIALLPGVAFAFGELVDEREGIVKARITTPVELAERERSDFVRRLEKATGKKVRATFAVDASLIGGALVQVGDRLVDTTLRTQLNALASQLAG
jgi:F-type H+-transporting ATPase subunit delta